MDIKTVIVGSLIKNEAFRYKVITLLDSSHYDEYAPLVTVIKDLSEKSIRNIQVEQIIIELQHLKKNNLITDVLYEQNVASLPELYETPEMDLNWLVVEAEKLTKDRNIFAAINTSISIYKGIEPKKTSDDIPNLLLTAVNTTFKPDLGYDYEEAADRHDIYNRPLFKIPFKQETLNIVTDGGAERGTLNMILAAINKGKTAAKCDLAAGYKSLGYNVVYFTMEMPEWKILQRIDANLLGIPINDIAKLMKSDFVREVKELREKGHGQLKVKKFNIGSGNVNKFNFYLKDAFLSDGFKPDIIIIDYIGICSSVVSSSAQLNSYNNLKNISVEFRAMAEETNAVLWTSMQFNREGIRSGGQGGMELIADSIGIPMTADFILAQERNIDLDLKKQVTWHQIKTRYGNASDFPSFPMDVDFAQSRYSDNEIWLNNARLDKPTNQGAVMTFEDFTKSFSDFKF